MDTVPQFSLKKIIIRMVIILVVAGILVWAIIYFWGKAVSPAQEGLSQAEKAQILSTLNEAATQSPKLTPNQKSTLISNLSRAAEKTPDLTPEQKAQIINNLSK